MRPLAEKIESRAFAPYVYSYPPVRTYASISDFSLDAPTFTREVNLYVHIPFCEQKCTFCGYLTTVTKSASFQDGYVDCIVREIGMYRDFLHDAVVKTVNFGGGTPSLLTFAQFARIMDALHEANASLLPTVEEISIEATPESVIAGKISAFQRRGLDRVSVGVQSLDDREIAATNRGNSAGQSLRALEILRNCGIRNTCVDLMYGLNGQSAETWSRSVRGIIAMLPQTVELYSTAVIPGTPLALRGGSATADSARLDHYVFARDAFLAAGYVQDCHLRFVRKGGGYLQQHNVFDGQSLIGFGAGARSYATDMHYRNVFDGANHRGAIREYMDAISSGQTAVRSAVILTDEEKLRRFVIYHIEHLDMDEFARRFGQPFRTVFPTQTSELLALGLAEEHGSLFRMMPKGLAYRDVIANAFFSAAAREAEIPYRSNSKA